MNRVIRFIYSTLTTRVTPLAYLVAIEAMVYGVSYAVFDEFSGVDATIIYKSAAFAGTSTWGIILIITSVALLFGMALRNKTLVAIGAFAGFAAWLFASLVYFPGHFWFQLSVAVIHMLMFGYLYLSSSMNQLWDFTPRG